MALRIDTTNTVLPKNLNYEILLQRAERGQLDWQLLLQNENRLAKQFGQEQFDKLLEFATAGKANFI